MKSNGAHIVTDPLRISYPHLFVAKALPGSEDKKFSVSLLIPKADKASIKQVEDAIKAATDAGIEKFGKEWKAKGKFHNPLNDGDQQRADDPAYQNHFFVNVSNERKPQVFDRSNKNPVTAEDADKVYPGCYCCVSLNFFPFNAGGNKGVAASLIGVLKAKEGEKLGADIDAAKDFEGIEQFDDLEIDGEGEDNYSYDNI